MEELAGPPRPSLGEIREAASSLVSKIVTWFVSGKHCVAHVDEIADGVGISNNAINETIYSAIDPYTDGAEKRDASKPMVFRRSNQGEFHFLGYDDDPLNLTRKIRFSHRVLRTAFENYQEMVTKSGKREKWQSYTTSKKISSFGEALEKHPDLWQSSIRKSHEQMEWEATIGEIEL